MINRIKEKLHRVMRFSLPLCLLPHARDIGELSCTVPLRLLSANVDLLL